MRKMRFRELDMKALEEQVELDMKALESGRSLDGIRRNKKGSSDSDRNLNAENFHRLWTECVDSKDYNKRSWQDVYSQLVSADIID